MRKIVLLLSVPLLAGTATYGVRLAVATWANSAPTLDCPALVNLGEWEMGQVARGHFIVGNRGNADLLLDQFQTSCSCAGVERKFEDRYLRIKDARILPGKQVELSVRVAVGARPGQSQIVHVFFHSNDPARPAIDLQVGVPRVKGGVYAQPNAVVFGRLQPNVEARRLVNLYDNGVKGRYVQSIQSSHPSWLKAKLLPITDSEKARGQHEIAGNLIGRMEVLVRADQQGRLEGGVEITLHGENRLPDFLPVSGEVTDLVSCWPSKLVLPRREEGHDVWSGACVLSGQTFDVKIESAPSGVLANLVPVGKGNNQWRLNVQLRDNDPSNWKADARAAISLAIRSGEQRTRMEIPVLIARVHE